PRLIILPLIEPEVIRILRDAGDVGCNNIRRPYFPPQVVPTGDELPLVRKTLHQCYFESCVCVIESGIVLQNIPTLSDVSALQAIHRQRSIVSSSQNSVTALID